MKRSVEYRVVAWAESGLLCKILAVFAQLDLPAPALSVEIDGQEMCLCIRTCLTDAELQCVYRKIGAFVGVTSLEMVDAYLYLVEGLSN
ncbi:hypothetical protein IM511_12510 [Erythrobacteraceae bacterium E2-1 Yellow Sea]|nr:hypothetical protein [Erythrobacteraceae bacterium E2-1 Yellow Sea]